MKAIVFSDLHAHTYQEFSESEGGLNSRLLECVRVLKRISEEAAERKVDAILFSGDIFHLKNYLDSHVIRLIIESFEEMSEVAPIYVCPGNHDYKGWDRDPVLLEFAAGRNKRVNLVSADIISGCPFFSFPYQRDVGQLQELVDGWKESKDGVALFHQDVVGMRYGGHEVIQGLDASRLSQKFGVSFVGHYHRSRKILDNVISVGAPLQHNFGDVGADVGWWYLDTARGFSPEFIPNATSPRFWDFEIREGEEFEIRGKQDSDYYRITISGGRDIPDEVKGLRWKRIIFKSTQSSSRRTDIKFSDSTEDLMVKYIKVRNAEGLDEERLLKIGRRYL